MKIMGILNVTPDSFSDGGLLTSVDDCIRQTEVFVEDDANIVDVGGESTRPFAQPVGLDEERQRVIPVIKAIRSHFPKLPISIDTTKAQIAKEALDSGANIINDISALSHDPEMIGFVARIDVPLIIMHMQGTPGNMQVNPHYSNVVTDILQFFDDRLDELEDQGIDRQRITIDPGIGFGKTLEHNLSILKHLERFHELGLPLLLGHSRKRFIGDITGLDVSDRDLPTAVVSAIGAMKNASILRVHNVKATRQALLMVQAINGAD